MAENNSTAQFDGTEAVMKAFVEAENAKNKGIPLDKLSELGSLAKVYDRVDKLNTLEKISKDDDKTGATAAELSKIEGVALGIKAGKDAASKLADKIKDKRIKAAIIGAGSVIGALVGEQGVNALEKNIRETANLLVDYYGNVSAEQFYEDLKYFGDFLRDYLGDGTINVSIYDPLVLDLDGDGVSVGDGAVYFDHNGDGVGFAGAWVGAGDGLLARDIDGDGRIGSGAELFGNYTLGADGELASDGFSALALLDSDANGVIDANDAEFASLVVWRDANGNGVSDDGELMSLQSAGVASLSLEFARTNERLANGSKITHKATYTTTNGESYALVDVDFKVARLTCVDNKFYSNKICA